MLRPLLLLLPISFGYFLRLSCFLQVKCVKETVCWEW